MFSVKRGHKGSGTFIRPSVFLLAIVLVTIIPYRHMIGRGFTDPDDYEEVYRALAVDLSDPSRILLDPHEVTRYRPMNRLVTAASTAIGGGTSSPFLLRNLFLHLINIGLVFGISLTLVSNPWPAALAAALFAVHPANVNAVSIAVFTQVFSTSVLLFGLYLFTRWLTQEPPKKGHSLALVSVLFVVVTFSSEMYLWVLPSYLLALLWLRRKAGSRRAYTGAMVLAIVGFVGYLLIRQLVVGQQGLPALPSGGRYGLRTPMQVIQNLGMLLVSGGMSLDFLHFINPAVETLPTSPGAIIANPGILISIALGLLFTLSTILAGAYGFVALRNDNLGLSFLFSVLFLASISVVLITTSASETHLYTANAFLSISVGLAFWELGKYLFRSNRPVHIVGRWLLVGVILLVLVSRAFGVENRNQVLLAKARRSQKLQQELAAAVANCQGEDILITSACKVPRGYSVYGGTGIELFQWPGFAQLSLNRLSLRTEVVELVQLDTGQISLGSNICVAVVDMAGNMYRFPKMRSEWDCD